MSEALQHGFCVHLECTALETEHVAHRTLFIAYRTLHNAHCVGDVALERPLSGLRLACWPDFETWCTSLELYNLSTSLRDPLFCNLFTLWGAEQRAAVRRMHLTLPRVETSGFGSGLDSAWTDCVWSGLIKMDCCTNFVLQTAL